MAGYSLVREPSAAQLEGAAAAARQKKLLQSFWTWAPKQRSMIPCSSYTDLASSLSSSPRGQAQGELCPGSCVLHLGVLGKSSPPTCLLDTGQCYQA